MRYLALTFLVTLSGLAACTTMDQNACQDTNWGEMGKQDGTSGYDRDRLEYYVNTCGTHDIAVNKDDWEAGYRIGLMQYCKPANAYAEGRAGRNLNDVCPAGLQSSLTRHHGYGVRYFKANRELLDFRGEGMFHDMRKRMNDSIDHFANHSIGNMQPRPAFYDLEMGRLQRKQVLYDKVRPE